jgi:PleD family two-component response regulator
MLIFDQIRNYLFLAIALSIGLLFLLVYVVRYYMYHQVCKSIVHSPEEGLHDREYCRLSLIQFCAQSDRTKRPLSTMIIQVDKNRKDSDQRVETLAEGLLKMESILKKGTRLSDVICRISDNQFFLIMPNTDEGGSQMAVARIKKMIRDKLGRYAEHLDVQLKAVTREPEEKCTAFWKRASKKL